MKIRVVLFAIFMFACLAGVSTRGQEGTVDYFLPPPCGGSPGPEPRPLAVTTETLKHHRIYPTTTSHCAVVYEHTVVLLAIHAMPLVR